MSLARELDLHALPHFGLYFPCLVTAYASGMLLEKLEWYLVGNVRSSCDFLHV